MPRQIFWLFITKISTTTHRLFGGKHQQFTPQILWISCHKILSLFPPTWTTVSWSLANPIKFLLWKIYLKPNVQFLINSFLASFSTETVKALCGVFFLITETSNLGFVLSTVYFCNTGGNHLLHHTYKLICSGLEGREKLREKLYLFWSELKTYRCPSKNLSSMSTGKRLRIWAFLELLAVTQCWNIKNEDVRNLKQMVDFLLKIFPKFTALALIDKKR